MSQSTQHTAHSTQRRGVSRILAVDVGTKRMGIAVSDPLGYTAQPLEVWECRTSEADVAHVTQLAHEQAAAVVIVGHPLKLDGTASPQTVKAEQFARALQVRCPCAVTLVDERLTTVQGERALLEAGVRRQRRRQVIDRVAAQVLLQHYLDTQRGVSSHE